MGQTLVQQLPAVKPQANPLASLCLGVFLCKPGLAPEASARAAERLNGMVHVKALLSKHGAHSLMGEMGRYTLALVPQDEHWTGRTSQALCKQRI